MRTEAEINWQVLREIVIRDKARWEKMAADQQWTDRSKARLEAKAEACGDILDSMDTLERTAAELTEATAAACGTITKAAPLDALHDPYVGHGPKRFEGIDTITKAAL